MKYHLIEEQLPTGLIIPVRRDFKSIITALQTPSKKNRWLTTFCGNDWLQNCFDLIATSATIRHKQNVSDPQL